MTENNLKNLREGIKAYFFFGFIILTAGLIVYFFFQTPNDKIFALKFGLFYLTVGLGTLSGYVIYKVMSKLNNKTEQSNLRFSIIFSVLSGFYLLVLILELLPDFVFRDFVRVFIAIIFLTLLRMFFTPFKDERKNNIALLLAFLLIVIFTFGITFSLGRYKF